MAKLDSPFIVLSIQIYELIIQRSACLHFQRSMLSKPNTPEEVISDKKTVVVNKAIFIPCSYFNKILLFIILLEQYFVTSYSKTIDSLFCHSLLRSVFLFSTPQITKYIRLFLYSFPKKYEHIR